MGRLTKKFVILLAGVALVAGCSKGSSSKSAYKPRNTNNGYTGPDAGQNVPQVPPRDQNEGAIVPVAPDVKANNSGQTNDNVQDPIDSEDNVLDPVLRDEDTVPEKLREDFDIENSQVEILGNAHQCGEAYKVTEPDWTPGTLFPPAQSPIFTGGESPRGYRYTDSHDDSVMAVLAEDFRRRVTGCRIKPSLELAQRISNVDVYTDIYDKAEARVSIELYDGSIKGKERSQKQKIVIHMMGSFGGKMTATRQPLVDGSGKPIVNLVQTNKAKGGLKFRGYLGCLDADFGCQTTVIVVEQLTKEGKVCRTAFAIHRHGNAHVTIHPNDREYGRGHRNRNYAQFANYLGNTVDAACVQILRDIESDARRGMPQCAIKRMKQECGGLPIREPYARIAGLKTWSVLYGTAKFKFFMDDVITVEGPLVYSKVRPILESQKIYVSGIAGVKRGYLVNNDGAGQLNLGLKFSGQPEGMMRITVSSILKDSIFGSERMKLVKNVSAQTSQEEYITDEGQVVPLPGQSYDPDKEFNIDDQASDGVIDGDAEINQKDPRATQNDEQKK